MLLRLVKIVTLMMFIRHLTLCHLSDVYASRTSKQTKKTSTVSDDDITDESAKIQKLVQDGVSP